MARPIPGNPTGVTKIDKPIPSFMGKLVAAFRGSVVPSPGGPSPWDDQVGTHVMDPTRVPAVRNSQYGAPSSRALQVIVGLPEYANMRVPFSGEYFVADTGNKLRVVRRRMQAPPIVAGLVASRNADYSAPMYVGVPPGQGLTGQEQSPAFRAMGAR